MRQAGRTQRCISEQNRIAAARKKLKECDDKLAKYRQALEKYRQASEAGTDPAIVGEWIEEVKLARKAAEVASDPVATAPVSAPTRSRTS